VADCFICNAQGESKDRPSEQDLRKFLRELDPADVEHGAVWVSDHDGNTLEFSIDGRLVFSRDGLETRHLVGTSFERVLELWQFLIDERFDDLESQPWIAGTRAPFTPEESARSEGESAEWLRHQDRKFYQLLGSESETELCRRDGCQRGRISHSALCRVHHFESIRERPCPFDD